MKYFRLAGNCAESRTGHLPGTCFQICRFINILRNPDLYLGGTWFESGPWNRLLWDSLRKILWQCF